MRSFIAHEWESKNPHPQFSGDSNNYNYEIKSTP